MRPHRCPAFRVAVLATATAAAPPLPPCPRWRVYVPIHLTAENGAAETLECQAVAGHWYSFDLGTVTAASRLSFDMAVDPKTGTVVMYNGIQENQCRSRPCSAALREQRLGHRLRLSAQADRCRARSLARILPSSAGAGERTRRLSLNHPGPQPTGHSEFMAGQLIGRSGRQSVASGGSNQDDGEHRTVCQRHHKGGYRHCCRWPR